MLCSALKIGDGASWDPVLGGDALLSRRRRQQLKLRDKTFHFLAAGIITDDPAPQIAVETRDHTPTGRPSAKAALHSHVKAQNSLRCGRNSLNCCIYPA